MGIETYSSVDSSIQAKKNAKKKEELEALKVQGDNYTKSSLVTDPEKEGGVASTGFYKGGGYVSKAGFGDFLRKAFMPMRKSDLFPVGDVGKMNFGEIVKEVSILPGARPFKYNKDHDAEGERLAKEKERTDALDSQDITNAEQGLAKGGYVPKGDFGLSAIIIGTALSAAMAAKKKVDADKQKKEQEELSTNQSLAENAGESVGPVTEEVQRLPEQPTYQAQGGNLNNSQFKTKGGKLKQLSSDTTLAEGNKHSQGGVKLYDKGGEPQAEIEGGETIKEDGKGARVYSDRLVVPNSNKTFADVSKALAKQKGKLEKSLVGGANKIKNYTVKRQISSIENKEENLFATQEQLKKEQGIEQDYVSTEDFAYGGKVPKGFYGFLDNDKKKKYTREEQNQISAGVYQKVDNTIGENKTTASPDTNKGGYNTSVGDIAQGVNIATNLFNTFTKPKAPSPRLINAPTLETNVNKNAERGELREGAEKAKKFVSANTSQSRTAVGRVARIDAEKSLASNKITQDELNQERDLRNQNVLLRSQTQAQNAGLVNAHNQQKLNRSLAQRQEISEAAANTAGYVQRKEQIQKEHDLAREEMNIYANTLDNNGTSGRIDETVVRSGYSKAKASGDKRMMRLYELQASRLGITLN